MAFSPIGSGVKAKLATKAAEHLINAGLSKFDEYSQKKAQGGEPPTAPKAPEADSPVVNVAEKFLNGVFPSKHAETPTAKAAAKAATAEETNKQEVRDALHRLSGVAASLEEADSHRMIADIIRLVRESPTASVEEKADWTAYLYGRRD